MAEVQISADGGAIWDVLRHWEVNVPGPHLASIDLTPYAGAPGALVRFYYDDRDTDAGWWQIDDVQVVGCRQFDIFMPLILCNLVTAPD